MISFVPSPTESAPRMLILGAHSDDIEIGCGGTVRMLLDEYPTAPVMWVVFSGNAKREEEARASAALYLGERQDAQVVTGEFRDGRFPFDASEMKEFFANRLQGFQPDIVFTHYRDDRHQDHRIVSELTWQTFRNNLVLEYEIPKYDGDLGQPNMYVELSEHAVRRKIYDLETCFGTQRSKHWFDEVAFRGLMRMRGIECAAGSGYAEAFHARKFKAF